MGMGCWNRKGKIARCGNLVLSTKNLLALTEKNGSLVCTPPL